MTGKKLPQEVLEILNGRELEEMAIRVIYRNWKGEEGIRHILPLRVWYGSTEWHKKEQWLMKVYDIDKEAMRDYALKDFKGSPES